jgi:hypothetical protein
VSGGIGGAAGGGVFFGVGAAPGAALAAVVGGILGAAARVITGGLLEPAKREIYDQFDYKGALQQAKRYSDAEYPY